MAINKHELQQELKEELERKKSLQNLFTADYIRIELDRANEWLYVDWIGYQTEESVVKGCTTMLELLKEHHLSKVLNDNTNVLGIWTPAAQWVGAVWFPEMKDAGLQKFAWIYSPSRLSQISTEAALDSTTEKDIIRTFFNRGEAEAWLRVEGSDQSGNAAVNK